MLPPTWITSSYTYTWAEHVRRVGAVLESLRQAGVTANPGKCAVGRREVRYLGYHLGGGQVPPQVDKTAAIAACPRPKTKKEVRRFLGLAGYYRRFIPGFAALTSRLTDLGRKGASDPVQWTERCQWAVEAVKHAVCGEPLLHTPNFSLPFILQTDASNRGLGAVLSQQVQGVDRPVLYISRKLSEGGQVQYSGEGVPGHPVGGRLPAVLPPRTPIHPLFGPRPAPMAPPHEGYKRPDHLVVSGSTAI
ncbi:uncharacterized protein LOC119215672 [Pungitius pungitius]|uniref:uncharacterized protein LOC119215672 n=1 Tax=Pungitius pungitius TaxID=134920 RepID=UPI001887D06B|nr:uncharacterized protein LOC119215672 [Pungitius pungitius]